MSEVLIFIVGVVVFSITTTATLLYGYASFLHQSEEQGIGEVTPSESAPVPASTHPSDPRSKASRLTGISPLPGASALLSIQAGR